LTRIVNGAIRKRGARAQNATTCISSIPLDRVARSGETGNYSTVAEGLRCTARGSRGYINRNRNRQACSGFAAV
jgi:hypothetical protein